jgi:hypothetical protein
MARKVTRLPLSPVKNASCLISTTKSIAPKVFQRVQPTHRFNSVVKQNAVRDKVFLLNYVGFPVAAT